MNQLQQKEFAVTKVLARADKWYDARQQARANQCSEHQTRLRAVGRYEKAGDMLAESVESLRKTDAAGAQP